MAAGGVVPSVGGGRVSAVPWPSTVSAAAAPLGGAQKVAAGARSVDSGSVGCVRAGAAPRPGSTNLATYTILTFDRAVARSTAVTSSYTV